MKTTESNQEPARQAWEWLWGWVKRNDRNAYKARYVTAKLADRIGCTPGAVSSWKMGRMNFDPPKYQMILRILDEWCALLPVDGWVTPCHYSDEDGVQHLLDYKGTLSGRHFVEVDFRCHSCGGKTPGAGACCMHCGHELAKPLELE